MNDRQIYITDSGPGSEPVTLSEVQAHLGLTLTGSPASHSDDDRISNFLIPTARQMVEAYTSRALVSRTFTQYFGRWPAGSEFRLARAPLSSVTSIAYIATAGGTYSTVSTDVYEVDTVATPGRVHLKANQEWPTPDAIQNAVKVTYVAGYGAATDIPQAIRCAMFWLIAHLYENAEATSTLAIQEIPWGVRSLLAPYRVFQL